MTPTRLDVFLYKIALLLCRFFGHQYRTYSGLVREERVMRVYDRKKGLMKSSLMWFPYTEKEQLEEAVCIRCLHPRNENVVVKL